MESAELHVPEGFTESFRVKNTFIEPVDPEDVPPPPAPGQLGRSATAPPRMTPVAQIFLHGDDPDEPAVLPSEDPDPPADEHGEELEDPPEEAPPVPGELERLRTRNQWEYEPEDDWNWQPSGACSSGAVPMDPSLAAQMMHHVAVPMQPSQMMPGQMVYMPMPVYSQGQPGELLPHPVHGAAPPQYPAPGAAAQWQLLPQDAAASTADDGRPPRPQHLARHVSQSTNRTRISWTVDARKLRGSDKQAVSPKFDLNVGGRQVPFKLVIYPKQVADQKGGASFKKSKGRGSVVVKCEADLVEGVTSLRFRLFIGDGNVRLDPRGPFTHDFSMNAYYSLPKDDEEWDFNPVIDDSSKTFVVGLETQ